jgi:hypothetical protein
MKHLISRRSMGFSLQPILRKKEPHPFHYLAQRTSFWLAIFSLFAFVAGNMIGQHGWQVFWKSVMGQGDDSLIVYTGTVTPIALVPDYSRWNAYGGNAQEHTFREVPQDALVPLPVYAPGRVHNPVYSVEYMGSYATGIQGTGSHPAVDIRVPVGTPVRSIANGIVSEVKEGGGFGKTIVIRHPNVPDPANPRLTTVLYSNYAHLSSIYVREGSVVEKGEQIGLSGATGDVSGPHLHFQIDRDDAPWHPYWPFTTQDISSAGLRTTVQAINASLGSERGYTFTVNPLLYVQAEYSPVTTVVQRETSSSSLSSNRSASMLSLVQARAAARMARLKTTVAMTSSVSSVLPASSAQSSASPVVVRRDVVVVSRTEIAMSLPTPVASVEIWHDGTYTDRGWERVRLTLLDAQGNVVTSPVLDRDIVLKAAFGSADFQPATLTSLDFQNGKAEVSVLPHGRRTLVIQVMPFNVLSQPMRYEKN